MSDNTTTVSLLLMACVPVLVFVYILTSGPLDVGQCSNACGQAGVFSFEQTAEKTTCDCKE